MIDKLKQQIEQTPKATAERYQMQALLELYFRLEAIRTLADSLAAFILEKK